METKFNFKSSVCTSREQSERLLALGLKKETADMVHYMNGWGTLATPWRDDYEGYKCYYPAWSLGRLIEMMPRTVIMHTQEGDALIDIDLYAMEILASDDSIAEAVSIIEWLIKEGNFNKLYLEIKE